MSTYFGCGYTQMFSNTLGITTGKHTCGASGRRDSITKPLRHSTSGLWTALLLRPKAEGIDSRLPRGSCVHSMCNACIQTECKLQSSTLATWRCLPDVTLLYAELLWCHNGKTRYFPVLSGGRRRKTLTSASIVSFPIRSSA